LAGQPESEFQRLLRIMRLVARHPAYRERADDLVSRTPDDIFYDEELGWAVTYQLSGDRTLGFAIAGPEDVTEQSRVYRAYECRELL
jgi:hypothetical protein